MLKYTVVLACFTFLLTSTARAALSPGHIEKMKAEASEVFVIEVTAVDIAVNGFATKIIYTAKVTAVTRSKNGVKAGQTIKIQSYDKTELIPKPGPVKPPRLKVGWKGKAYTRFDKKTKRYSIAVYGHSFEPAK